MENQNKKYIFQGTGLTEEQILWGNVRFNEYITSFPHLSTSGNAPLLEDLVWVEVMFEWLKRQRSEQMNIHIMKKSAVKETKDVVTGPINEQIQQYRDEIIKLKTKLNMFDDPKVKDTFSQLEELFAKHDEYRATHLDDFLCTCPYCSELFVMMCRTKDYEPVKTPFFEDKVLFNRPLMEMYHQNILTKEQTAKVLGVNPRFIDWLDAKFYGIKNEESAPLNTESAPTNQ
jgi:hypothetical protein